MSNSIGKVARAINKSVLSGSKKALNKAISKTKTKLKKDLKADTGLSSEVLDKRINAIKTKGNKLNGSVNVAVKHPIQLSEFKPKEKIVKVAPRRPSGKKGRPKKRTYYGVTVKIGNSPRELVPTGFLRTVKSGKEIILSRVNQLDNKSKLKTLTTDVLKKAAMGRQSEAKKFLKEEFDREHKALVNSELEKNLSKIQGK